MTLINDYTQHLPKHSLNFNLNTILLLQIENVTNGKWWIFPGDEWILQTENGIVWSKDWSFRFGVIPSVGMNILSNILSCVFCAYTSSKWNTMFKLTPTRWTSLLIVKAKIVHHTFITNGVNINCFYCCLTKLQPLITLSASHIWCSKWVPTRRDGGRYSLRSFNQPLMSLIKKLALWINSLEQLKIKWKKK